MAITYPLTLPSTPAPTRVQFFGDQAVGVSVSPFTRDTQVQEHQGDKWLAEVEFPEMEGDTAYEFVTFLMKLHGRAGSFYLSDPLKTTPRGIASGLPIIDGADQEGYELNTKGWTPNTANIYRKGDYIQLGTYLYCSLNDVSSDADGKCTLDIWPRLRVPPANEETIITENCQGIFRLSENVTPFWSADKTKLYSISFSCEEAR